MTHTSDKHVTDEELELVTRGKADGIYMKAPNGSPTSLNERQWVQVRCNLQIFLCLFLEKLNMPQNTPVTKAS